MTAPLRSLVQSDRALCMALTVLMTLLAWAYLGVMTQAMRHHEDMAQLGPGMGIFNLAHQPDGAHHETTLRRQRSTHRALPQSAPGDVPSFVPRHFGMPQVGRVWKPVDFALVFVMWLMMMVAMMLPTASPMILTYSDILGQRESGPSSIAGVALFIAGYLGVWSAFSLVAVFAQWLMLKGGVLTALMVSSSAALSGGLLALAGIYQWSPLKTACLTHCRTPLQFFLSSWRPGLRGALRMGAQHGVYCAGCCWALMGLMYFAGLMNLLWIAGLSVLMLLEKVMPRGDLFARAVGVVLLISGISVLLSRVPQ